MKIIAFLLVFTTSLFALDPICWRTGDFKMLNGSSTNSFWHERCIGGGIELELWADKNLDTLVIASRSSETSFEKDPAHTIYVYIRMHDKKKRVKQTVIKTGSVRFISETTTKILPAGTIEKECKKITDKYSWNLDLL